MWSPGRDPEDSGHLEDSEEEEETMMEESEFGNRIKVPIHLRAPGCKRASLVGSWNSWGQRYDLARMDHTRTSQDGDFLGLLALPPGRYEFKFVIDGVWQTNEAWPVAKDKRGILNNILEVVTTEGEKGGRGPPLRGGVSRSLSPSSFATPKMKGRQVKRSLRPPSFATPKMIGKKEEQGCPFCEEELITAAKSLPKTCFSPTYRDMANRVDHSEWDVEEHWTESI